MSTAPPVVPVVPAAPAKVSWLKKVGQFIAKVIGFAANKAAPIADQAAQVAELLLPQFAPTIAAADGLVTKIAKQAVVTEALSATLATPMPGATKLQTVLANVGPEIDTWVANAFPGATQVSAAAKAGLVNAVVAITNEMTPATAASPVSTPAVTA